MKPLDYVVIALILFALFAAVIYMVKHKNSCCGGCNGCKGDCQSCKRK